MYRFNQIKIIIRPINTIVRPSNTIIRRPFRANCCGKTCDDCPKNNLAENSVTARLIGLAKFGIGMTGAVLILGNPFGYHF